ncbi:TPA: type II secretion system protein [Burkholderia territorii]|uniref:type II secretion system protein n=1 Tax=Burkholderia territorii TaxID=1503055 RepID=UPI0011C95ED9|nr:type II secretion system protein [Burkholderia territorii]TXG23735.1 type II secretion system protein [Burkholderia territorii]HDR8858408.1 type II secretion system protein [Burkholderia territorii]HDR8868188.1 type II secretion system protein [Burkholderia territorii]HDR8874333.1 type II secretion system protein [Burkholderia territorii]HDR8875866.1 type II secretion system protein [Burkholderia territorii]
MAARYAAPRSGRVGRIGLRGFTLIEMVVTLALVAILALAIMPFSELLVQRQKEQELSAALREIRTALDAYKEASDEGKIEKEAESSGYPPSLTVLVTGVKDARDPKGGLVMFLRRVPRDPFFTGDPDTPDADTWDVRAYGTPPDQVADGPPGGIDPGKDVFDVTSKSARIGINGIPYKQW